MSGAISHKKGNARAPLVAPIKGKNVMMRMTLAAATALALAAGPALVQPAWAQQKTVKIGFLSTFSGPTAAIGNDMRNAFELALDHLDHKIGGLPVEVIYEDDTQKPDIGVQKTQELIESDHVDFVVGYIWSNVLLASLKPLVDSKTITVVTNAGPNQLAGQELTRWPDQLDFSAELSKARAAKPDAIFAFYPGGAGVQFVTQYVQ